MCLSIYKHSCCVYLIINQVVSSGKISMQAVAFGSRALKTGECTIFACVIAIERSSASVKTNTANILK